MTEPTLWWVLSWGLIATGLAGAVLPTAWAQKAPAPSARPRHLQTCPPTRA